MGASAFDEDVFSKITTFSKISIALLLLAKFCGMAAVGLALAGMMVLGTICLVLAGASLVTIFILCALDMRKQHNAYQKNKTAIQKMEEDGTLIEQLRAAGYKVYK